jgi:hypothetical protein
MLGYKLVINLQLESVRHRIDESGFNGKHIRIMNMKHIEKFQQMGPKLSKILKYC